MIELAIGIGDLCGSSSPQDRLVTRALGSCVAVILRDPVRQVCAMAHVVVPSAPSPGAPAKVGYHAPTAVPALVDALRRLGGRLDAPVEAVLIGGAAVIDGLSSFDVGRRNVLAVRRALWALGLVPVAEDVEGNVSRSVTVEVGSGRISVYSPTLGTWTVE